MPDIEPTGDGASGAPAEGAQPVSGGQPASSPAQAAEPRIFELDDDALIKPKGFEKPVKFGEHVRGLQSQFTKASQRAAALDKQVREQTERIRQFEEASRASEQQGHANTAQQTLAALAAKPYLSGRDAAQVVQAISQSISQRDMVLEAVATEIKAMKEQLSTVYNTHTESAFDTRLTKMLEDNGYGPDYLDLAKEIFLAYEGDDLWSEFPGIFESRITGLRQAEEAARRRKLEAARTAPFVPGRGGQASPSRPLQLTGRETPQQIAQMVWDARHGTSAET